MACVSLTIYQAVEKKNGLRYRPRARYVRQHMVLKILGYLRCITIGQSSVSSVLSHKQSLIVNVLLSFESVR